MLTLINLLKQLFSREKSTLAERVWAAQIHNASITGRELK